MTDLLSPSAVRQRVAYWQRALALLGIGHWEFTVQLGDHPSDPSHTRDSHATVMCADDYDHATFWFSWTKIGNVYDLDRSIIHEWLHVALRDHDEALERVERWMTDHVYDEWDARVEHEIEGFIERAARLLQESLPAPGET